MPRKSEPSFRLKEIIWDLAATAGTQNLSALYKDLEYNLRELRKKEEIFEELPDIRTIKRIIELDIQALPRDIVLLKLPPHVWRLRNDYQQIKQLDERNPKPDQQVVKLLQDDIRSNFLLERRVVGTFRDTGYWTTTDVGFLDPENNKSRKYDVYADMEIKFDQSEMVRPVVFCQCRNNAKPISFFVDDKKEFKPFIEDVRISGIPLKIWQQNKNVPLQELLNVQTFHHYCQSAPPCSKKYSVYKKGEDWHTDSSNETERILAEALENEIDWDFKGWYFPKEPQETEKEYIDLSFYYPLVIYAGEINAIYLKGKGKSYEEIETTTLKHIRYTPEFYSFYNKEELSYHIDIITEEYLPDYLKVIKDEMIKVQDALQAQKDVVRQSIDKIAAECRSLDPAPENYRKYLEYKF